MAPRDPFDYMTTASAAGHFGVSEACIRKWVERGRLQPVGRGPRGKMLFRVTDAALAELATSKRARRAA
jgi:predicted site-specific integrase-resolvase